MKYVKKIERNSLQRAASSFNSAFSPSPSQIINNFSHVFILPTPQSHSIVVTDWS